MDEENREKNERPKMADEITENVYVLVCARVSVCVHEWVFQTWN